MKSIVALCKRRGIIYPNSEIYGGFANTWDYGPYGVLLKNNVKKAWWDAIVKHRDDVVGLDSAILMNPKVWEASGHLKEFTDPMVECLKCNTRHKFPDAFPKIKCKETVGGYSYSAKRGEYVCPKCGSEIVDKDGDLPLLKFNTKQFNLMFQTFIGPTAHKEFQPSEMEVEGDGEGGMQTYEGAPARWLIEYDPEAVAYLRPETAQGIFVNFKNVLDSTRVKIPFGIAQIGKAFRNEITPGNFTFRTLEFEQFELEYFVDPKNATKSFKEWTKSRLDWYISLGIDKKKVRLEPHSKKDLAHYAKAITDVEYDFPFGWSELEGIANRGDYDLKQHQKASGKSLEYTPVEGKKFLPHVIEPSGGVDRAILAFLVDSYKEEIVKGEKRTVLSLDSKLAPIKVAILPLIKKTPLITIAKKIYEDLKKEFFVEYDESGTVGKRYRRQDEIGTPYCITIDFDSLKDKKVTVRDRDSMGQKRIKISELQNWLSDVLQS